MNAHDFERIDRGLVDGTVTLTRQLAVDYAFNSPDHPSWSEILNIKKFSMMGPQTLMMCRAFALASRTGVLEIGAYIGGSTVALGKGLRLAGQKPMISIDHGGSNPTHHEVPTDDIHADWHKNLRLSGLEGVSTLIKGWSLDPKVVGQVERAAAGIRFDLLFLDADGQVKQPLAAYADLIADESFLIIDDYYNVSGASEKMSITQREVNELMAEGAIEQYVLAPFSTWFGRVTNRAALKPRKPSLASRLLRKSP